MQFIAIILFLAYNATCLLYFKRHFPTKQENWIYYVAVMALNLICYITMDLLNHYQIGVLVILASFILELKLLFKMDLLQILHGGGIYILIIYCSKGIIISIFSLLLHESVNSVLQQKFYYYIISIIGGILAIGFIQLMKKTIAPDEKIKRLFRNTSQMKFIVIYQFAILVYNLLINDGRFLNINFLWFSLLYLKSCVITIAFLAFVLNNSIRVSVLLEYELYTNQLQDQLERQVQHYRSYKNFTKNFQAFKHDYKNLMSTVKTLLKNNENQKATDLIDEIHDTMQRRAMIHKTYSENVLIDAILQDIANVCEEKNIRFSAILHIPEKMVLSDLDVVRVFSNVLNNAIEACCKASDISESFLEIVGSVNADWTFVEISNSFNGKVKFHDDELITTKENNDFHGIGLKVVKEIIEGVGGLVLIDPDQTKRIFTLKLYIPGNY